MKLSFLRDPQWIGWSVLLVLVALWTLAGAIPGYFAPAQAYLSFQGHEPSPEVLSLFQGSWGQTLLFALGYGIAAWNPRRHALIVALGAVGKVLFAVRVALGPELSTFGLVALVGDLVWATLLFAFLAFTGSYRFFDRDRSAR